MTRQAIVTNTTIAVPVSAKEPEVWVVLVLVLGVVLLPVGEPLYVVVS
jgi:hypothetical protein